MFQLNWFKNWVKNYHHKSTHSKSREKHHLFFCPKTSRWDAEVLVIFFISCANNKVNVVLLGHFSLDWRLPMVFSHLNNGPYKNYLAKAKLMNPLSVNGCQKLDDTRSCCDKQHKPKELQLLVPSDCWLPPF